MKEKIFVFGASGHAKVVIDIIEQEGKYAVAFLADDDPGLEGRLIFGYRVIGGRDALLAQREEGGVAAGVVAIGNNPARVKVAAWLAAKGFALVSAVHPAARLARGVSLGAGTVVMAGAVINSDTTVGENVVVNTRVSIDHDCSIGNGAHIAPGATLCGGVSVGDGSFVCAGATIIPLRDIGTNAVVGAGSTVIRDVPDGVTVVGTPARRVAT